MSKTPPAVPALVLETQTAMRSIAETMLILQELSGRLLSESVLEHETRRANAQSQRQSADTLRNRAARLAPGEHRDELLARADRFVKRAAIIDAGEVMPPELRYPLDSLRLVASAREHFAAALEALDRVDAAEVNEFIDALQPPTDDDAAAGRLALDTEAPAMLVRNELGRALEILGGYVDAEGTMRLRAFALETAAPQRPRLVNGEDGATPPAP